MTTFPPELWFHVAQFIPEDALYQLRCVNSVFLQLALGVRWRKVSITTRKTPQNMRLLDRLSDTLIARKVQNITICFATSDSRTIKESPVCGCHHTDYIGALQDGKKKVVGDVQMYHSKISYSQCFEGMMLEAIVRLCPGFLNLRNLTLDFANISPSFHSHRLSVFFRCLWTAVEGKLDCLSLVGSLSGYHSILHNPPTLRSLKQLDIQIVNHPHDLNGGLDANALLESISYFINRHSQTLNALKIWSLPSRSQAVDLSPLFSHLSSFPTLTSLDVRLAFNKLFDPSGLQYLIWNTSFTLRRLSLRLNPSGFSMPWDTESLLGCWLSSCLADPYAFSYLKVLDVYPSRQPESVFVLLECIKRASGGLQEITIRDQYLQNDEARAIINAASHCRNLVSLHLNVWEMDIHLIDLLSKKLPGLENLSLATVESQFDDFPTYFINCLRGRTYTGWRLQDISLYYGNREIDAKVMRALAQSISSVRYIFGKKFTAVK